MLNFALACLVANSPAPIRVTWTEPFSGQTERFALKIERETDRDTAVLRLTVDAGIDRDKTSQVFEDQAHNEFSSWDLAVPIAVAGSRSPQVLCKFSRPNWLDFILYSVGSDGVRRVFSFSCREHHAIKWHAVHGKLVSFDTFDRFEPVPERLQRLERVGHGWELRTTYRFSTRYGHWVEGSHRWESYRFGISPPGQVFEKPWDCHFLFKSSKALSREGFPTCRDQLVFSGSSPFTVCRTTQSRVLGIRGGRADRATPSRRKPSARARRLLPPRGIRGA
jgi:hypothetical protein